MPPLPHIETIETIGFYMRATLAFNGLRISLVKDTSIRKVIFEPNETRNPHIADK